MNIAEGIEMLELTLKMGDNQMVVHPMVIHDSDSYVLVDTGTPGYRGEILNLMAQAGIDANKPYSIILTHQDIDHVGSLPQFLTENGNKLEVYAHEEDKPYIDGVKPFIKFGDDRRAALLPSLPEKVRADFEAVFTHPAAANVTQTLVDGQHLPFGGGLIVIHTPGHTPGHISLYHEPSRTLIAGDAMVVQNGQLMGPSPHVTPEMGTALKSLRKLKKFPIETVICYHGGLFQGDVHERIDELTESLK